MFELTSRPGGLTGILKDAPREPLFSVTERDAKGVATTTEYTIPVEFPPTAAMLYAQAQNAGAEQATTWAMQLALGVEGFAALCSADVSREDFVRIVAVVVGKLQGLQISAPGASDPKAGKAPRKRR